jgi:hypothetical protein
MYVNSLMSWLILFFFEEEANHGLEQWSRMRLGGVCRAAGFSAREYSWLSIFCW